MGERTCPGCGVEILPGPRERNKRIWCDQACRQRTLRAQKPEMYEAIYQRSRAKAHAKSLASKPPCQQCGGPIPLGRKTCCGSPECLRARHAETERKRYVEDSARHRARVAAYRAERTPERVARDREVFRQWIEANRDRYFERKQANDAMRRARKTGATAERFDHVEVFDRDGWRCGICRKAIDRELVYPDPMSVSLDHVVPLARGGDHTRANTRATHLLCNVRRSVGRGEAIQLSLV